MTTRISELIVLIGLSVILLGITTKASSEQIQLIPLSVNRAFMLMPLNTRGIDENAALTDVELTNLTGTWFLAAIEFSPLRKNVAVSEQQIPYAFLMRPYQKKTFKDIKFSDGQVLWFNTNRTSAAAFCILSIDMICRGIFSTALSPEEYDKLLNSTTIEGFEAAGETIGNDTTGSLIACIAALVNNDTEGAVESFANFVFSTKEAKKQLWQFIEALWGEKSSMILTARISQDLINIINLPEKLLLMTELAAATFYAPRDDIVWLTARKKSEKRPIIELVSPLQITPGSSPYYVNDTLNASFGIANNDTLAIRFKQLVVAGRGPGGDNDVQDFSPETDVILNPGTCYQYKGTLRPAKPGNYHFFCAYQASDDQWHPSIDLGPGLTDADRIQNIKVSQLAASVSFKAGDRVKVVSRLGLWLRSSPEIIDEKPTNRLIAKPMPLNTELIIVNYSDNGIASNGYYWWLVQYKEQQGWCAEANYRRTNVFLLLIPEVIPLGKPGKPQHIDS